MTYFNTSKSLCLVSRPDKAGTYKHPLIQQIAHAGFDPLGMRQHFPCVVTSSMIRLYSLHPYVQNIN